MLPAVSGEQPFSSLRWVWFGVTTGKVTTTLTQPELLQPMPLLFPLPLSLAEEMSSWREAGLKLLGSADSAAPASQSDWDYGLCHCS